MQNQYPSIFKLNMNRSRFFGMINCLYHKQPFSKLIQFRWFCESKNLLILPFFDQFLDLTYFLNSLSKNWRRKIQKCQTNVFKKPKIYPSISRDGKYELLTQILQRKLWIAPYVCGVLVYNATYERYVQQTEIFFFMKRTFDHGTTSHYLV